MLLFRCILFGVAAATVLGQERSRDTYVGAVVQYMSLPFGLNADNIDLANTLSYKSIIEYAKSQNVDIIVFPEGGMTPIPSNENLPNHGLNSYTPFRRDVNDSQSQEFDENMALYAAKYRNFYKKNAAQLEEAMDTVLCDLYGDDSLPMEQLGQLSCFASRSQIYVVANHYERVDCSNETDPNCPDDDFYFYSTSVVFDREGRLIARYRKSTKFDEPWLDVPPEPEMVTFTADFGVTFGLLIGLDIMEPRITDKYADDPRVTDVLMSTSEFDLPFMTSTRDQANWAKQANVHLLVAGYGWDGDSGIYLGDNDPLDKSAPNNLPNTIFWTTIPIKSTKNPSHPARPLQLSTYTFNASTLPVFKGKEPKLELMPIGWSLKQLAKHGSLAIEPLDALEDSVNTDVCAGDICCNFQIETELTHKFEPTNARLFHGYSMVVLQSTYRLANGTLVDIELCAVMSCPYDKAEHCGKRRLNHPKDLMGYYPIAFNQITIEHRANTTRQMSFLAPLAFAEDTVVDDANITFTEINTNRFTTLTSPFRKSGYNITAYGINVRVIHVPYVPPNPRNSFFDSDWTLFFVVTALAVICLVVTVLVLLVKYKCAIGPKRRGSMIFSTVSMRLDSQDILTIPNDPNKKNVMIPMKLISYQSSPVRLGETNSRRASMDPDSARPLLKTTSGRQSPQPIKPRPEEEETNDNVAPASAFPPYKSTAVKSAPTTDEVFGPIQLVHSGYPKQPRPLPPKSEATTPDDRIYIPLSEVPGSRFSPTTPTPFNSVEALKDAPPPVPPPPTYYKPPARPPSAMKTLKPPMPLPADTTKPTSGVGLNVREDEGKGGQRPWDWGSKAV